MKLGDYNKFKEFFEANPDAQEAPDNLLEEPKEAPKPESVTVADLMKEIASIKEALAANQKSNPEPDEATKSEIAELKAPVKDLTTEMQKANQANSDLPKEKTADDILKEFLTGGK